jgi:cation diffusion facilitator family transporter
MARSNKSVYSALIANLLIAAIKFIAGSISNSAAMIAEGVHSLVDTINELLLLFGIRQSSKPPDASRPFGYGRELYFWSFIVSILIFGLGGGISIYQGILHIRHPSPPGDPFWNYMVLFLSIFFEGASFMIAMRQFNKERGDKGWWAAIKQSKDPSNFLVLFEDGAAVTGLLVVLACVYLGHRFNNPYLDGVASIIVGLILVGVSLILARESRSLLMGEGILPETQKRIRILMEDDPGVVRVLHILSTYYAPETIVLMVIVVFKDGLNTLEINKSIDRLQAAIKKEFTLVRYVLIQPELNEETFLQKNGVPSIPISQTKKEIKT